VGSLLLVSLAHVPIGAVPFIRAPRGGAAEMIARKLETKIRDHLASGGAHANLRLPSQPYAPNSGLFSDPYRLGSLERVGESLLVWDSDHVTLTAQ
jgi:hypothetical protein